MKKSNTPAASPAEMKWLKRPEAQVLNEIAREVSARYKNGAPQCHCCHMFRGDLIMEISQKAMRKWADRVSKGEER